MLAKTKSVVMVAALAIAVAMAGCRESEDGLDRNSMTTEEQYLSQVDEIRQAIIGTWTHDGNCRRYADGDVGDQILIENERYTVLEAEKDTLSFDKDNHVIWSKEQEPKEGSTIPRIMNGDYEITGGYGPDIVIAPGIRIDYHINNYPNPDYKYIIFSQDKKYVFFPQSGFLLRYRKM